MPSIYRPLIYFSLLSILMLSSCRKESNYEAEFPLAPVNFDILNTPYNDYNSNIGPGRRMQITFSSDRNGSGHYDFVVKRIDMEFLASGGELFMEVVTNDDETIMNTIVRQVNTDANELGPYSTGDGDNLFLLYASDVSGNLDIKYVVCENVNSEQAYYDNQQVSAVLDIERLNTEYNEAYPCIADNYLFLCSDEGGNYNIGYTYIDLPFQGWLMSDYTTSVIYASSVNSDADDKCPYVIGNMMVFASDREGGYGGFDLYYCLRDADGIWGDPVNFGPEINSEADEYRPVIASFPDFNNDLMVFSSDRDGGFGGFDLYYVGVSKMINLQRY